MRVERAFPPRCCQPIPFERAKRLLTKDAQKRYLKKANEYSIGNRTYCSVPTCCEFIPPKKINNDNCATCPKCKASTCSLCKNAYHGAEACPQDEGRRAMLNLATARGWAQCRRCYVVVEMLDGCSHMHCLCGHDFCYLCGATWKTCGCGPIVLEGGERVGPFDDLDEYTSNDEDTVEPAQD